MSTRKVPFIFVSGYWFRITGKSKYRHKDKKMNLHSEHCRSVRQARNRLARLESRAARPRSIRRQKDRLEARKACAEARREHVAEAKRVIQSMVDEAFLPSGHANPNFTLKDQAQ